MKKILTLCCVFCALLSANAFAAADITLYYSPSCPHCHHARDFINGTLVYEYPTLKFQMIDLAQEKNREEFFATVKKCEFESNGVPVIIVNEKCFQGFDTPETSGVKFRDALNAGLTDSEKAEVAKATAEFNANPEQYRANNTNRAAVNNDTTVKNDSTATVKKTGDNYEIYYYGLLIILVAGFGFVLFTKKKK